MSRRTTSTQPLSDSVMYAVGRDVEQVLRGVEPAEARGWRYFIWTMTGPSMIAGGYAGTSAAFFLIHSRATFTLSSAPDFSLQTVIDIPPSPLRTSV